MVSEAEIWDWLAEVPDPEIPVISVTDLGMVRDVRIEGEGVVIAVTPTYSGCPALAVIDADITAHLADKGVREVRVERRLSPAWTTDWITEAAKARLRDYGIAPPVPGLGALRRGARRAVACPRCGSEATEQVSAFGSTPCKAAWRCTACLEPFDYFKCL